MESRRDSSQIIIEKPFLWLTILVSVADIYSNAALSHINHFHEDANVSNEQFYITQMMTN